MTDPNAVPHSPAEVIAEAERLGPAPSVCVMRSYVDEFTASDEYTDQEAAVANWMTAATATITKLLSMLWQREAALRVAQDDAAEWELECIEERANAVRMAAAVTSTAALQPRESKAVEGKVTEIYDGVNHRFGRWLRVPDDWPTGTPVRITAIEEGK